MLAFNEAKVIARCIASVKKFISAWCIIDSHSSDGMKQIVQSELGHLPGMIVDRTWEGFAVGRNQSVELAKQFCCDYLLIIDADDTLELSPTFTMPMLTSDQYFVQHRDHGYTYSRQHLLKASIPWVYEGIIHEEPSQLPSYTHKFLDDAWILSHCDGHSHEHKKEKYLRDAALLEAELAKNPQNSRYQYYLAQSYKDAGEFELAIKHYDVRARMPGQRDEAYVSQLLASQLREILKRSDQEIISSYIVAHELEPIRPEASYYLTNFLQAHGCNETSYMFAKRAVDIISSNLRQKDFIYCEDAVYDWKAYDALSVSAYVTGKLQEAVHYATLAHNCSSLPESERMRISENLRTFSDIRKFNKSEK